MLQFDKGNRKLCETLCDFGVVCYSKAELQFVSKFVKENKIETLRFGRIKHDWLTDIDGESERSFWRDIITCPDVTTIYLYDDNDLCVDNSERLLGYSTVKLNKKRKIKVKRQTFY